MLSSLNKKLDWQQELILAVSNIDELCRMVELDPNSLKISNKAIAHFPLKVPRNYVSRMRKGDPNDPLLKQILPQAVEDIEVKDYSLDTLHEASVNPIRGLLHKYPSRVLLTISVTCAINCRYCFRRHFPYSENNPALEWDKILNYIEQDPSINEVILSGGDPLLLNDRTLTAFTDQLASISHIKRLRIHSRIPIVLPERISDDFLDWIKNISQTPILIIHCNHPQEINSDVIEAMNALKQAVISLYNQTVLLKEINDNPETLAALSEALFAIGVQPYYLHVFDKVQGAAHFDMEHARARALYRELNHRLPGYLVPKLVQEVPGEKAIVIWGT